MFFLKKTTSKLHLVLCFYPQCHFHLAPYVFLSFQIFPFFFFLISWAFSFFFQYQTVFFEYLLWFYIHFLQISITSSRSCSFSDASSSPRPVALTSPLLFDLHLFMTVVKWSVPFFAVIQVIGYILLLVLLFLPQDLLSNIPLLFILLIMWMSFSLFHEMTDLKKVKNKRLVYKLFKTWRQNAIASV